MNTCPNCEFLIPTEAITCQFCKTDLRQWTQARTTAPQPSAYPTQPGGYPAQTASYPAQYGGYQMPPGSYPGPHGVPRLKSTSTTVVAIAMCVAMVVLVGLVSVAAVTQLGQEAELASEGPFFPSGTTVADSTSIEPAVGYLTLNDCALVREYNFAEINLHQFDPEVLPAARFIWQLGQWDDAQQAENLVAAALEDDITTGIVKFGALVDDSCSDPIMVEAIRTLEVIPPLLQVPADPSYCAALETVAAEGSGFVGVPAARAALLEVAPELHREFIEALPDTRGGPDLSEQDRLALYGIGVYAEGVCLIPGGAERISVVSKVVDVPTSI